MKIIANKNNVNRDWASYALKVKGFTRILLKLLAWGSLAALCLPKGNLEFWIWRLSMEENRRNFSGKHGSFQLSFIDPHQPLNWRFTADRSIPEWFSPWGQSHPSWRLSCGRESIDTITINYFLNKAEGGRGNMMKFCFFPGCVCCNIRKYYVCPLQALIIRSQPPQLLCMWPSFLGNDR